MSALLLEHPTNLLIHLQLYLFLDKKFQQFGLPSLTYSPYVGYDYC